MKAITLPEALQAIASRESSNTIKPADVYTLMHDVKGATFAGMTSVTEPKLASPKNNANVAALNGDVIYKVTNATVILANNMDAAQSMYVNKVKRTTSKPNVEFKATERPHYKRTDVHCMLQHVTKGTYYIEPLYVDSATMYILNGQELSKQEVAEYLTPGEAKKLLNPPTEVYNKKNDITHEVVNYRTPKLDNFVRLAAMGDELTA